MIKLQAYRSISDEVFHVHTHRCKHASLASDFEYVEKAMELGAKRIVFTDHAPFPDNPFGNRMLIEELPEYISSISNLKKEYKKSIEVYCGLEIEYLPSFEKYYLELKKNEGIALLTLGQHFYEYERGKYSFEDEDNTKEFKGLCQAMVSGINTGLFDVVAHPDRAFRRCKQLGKSEMELAQDVIRAASENGVYLEKNYSSMHKENQYREEFWTLLPPKAMVIYGLDAHSIMEMEEGYEFVKSIKNNKSLRLYRNKSKV